jgi:glycosyltransferase involved in cell wall biosynthesis
MVHAHNLYSAALALSARRKYRYKVVLDYHGRIPEEYVFLGKGGSASRKALEVLERWCVKQADHVIVVSQKLGEYLTSRYRIPPDKVSVIPCCTDPSIFKWDPVKRDTIRQSMNCGNRFVCTHLGSFSQWYDPDLLLNIFKQILRETDAHLMVVTADVDQAAEFLGKNLPREQFTVRSAAHDEVPDLLNASDIGLLLLRQSPNIDTSSPVKFAEYLNCGLPVLITGGVGDYSRMTMERQVGATVTRDESFDVKIIPRISGERASIALHCQAVGRDLTWSSYSDTWRQMLSSIKCAGPI